MQGIALEGVREEGLKTKMDKTLKIVIILVCVLSVLLTIVGWVFLPTCTRFLNQTLTLFNLPDTRGLHLNPIYMRTNSEKYPTVENTGKETAFISRFHDENNDTIEADPEFWNGSCYALPSGKFVTLMMGGQQFYSHEIFVEFSDGYECKLGNI
jgi:hypothetical protein